MLTERVVTEAVRAAGLDAPVHFFEVTGSTNSDLLRLAEENAIDWTVAVANHQEAGRGRLGRTWASEPGSSLLASVLLRPDILPADAPLLTLGAGTAMARSCREVCGVDVVCKWPNDLLVGQRKLGGVLAEAKVQKGRILHAVIGTGVNLTQGRGDFPFELRENATSVSMEGGRSDAAALLADYLIRLRRLCDASGVEFRKGVLEAYREVCDTLGRLVRATTTLGVEIVGRAEAIGSSGELIVRSATRREKVGFGEISHLD